MGSTSKLNYLDPRISAQWCKMHKGPKCTTKHNKPSSSVPLPLLNLRRRSGSFKWKAEKMERKEMRKRKWKKRTMGSSGKKFKGTSCVHMLWGGGGRYGFV